jgi:hypothetical protein
MNMNYLFSWLKLIALLIIIPVSISLTGCANPVVVKKDDVLPEGQGMVVLHVSNAFVSTDNWHWIEIWSESEKRVYFLHREEAKESRINEYPATAHFSGALPPGTYRIDAFKLQQSFGTYIKTLTAPVGDKLGKFKVEPGRLTDLGTVIYYPEYWDLDAGSYRLFLVEGTDNTRAVKEMNPVAYNTLRSHPPLGWTESSQSIAPNVTSQIKDNLPHFNQLVETKSGEIYAGGMLGKIFKRKKSGEWVTLDTGTSGEIFRIEEASNTLYATSERMVLTSLDGGLTWKPVALPAQTGRLEFFHIAADGTQYLYILTDSKVLNSFNLYSRKTDIDQWALVARNTYDTGSIDKIWPSMYQISSKGELIFTPGSFNNYILATDHKNVSRDLIVGCKIIRYFDDGGIYAIQNGLHLSAATQEPELVFYDPVKRENDKRYQWKGAQVYDLYFSNRNTGYIAIKLAGKSKSEIIKTTDGGKSWETVPDTSGFTSVYVTREGTLLKIGYEGTVFSTNNDGKSWVRERGPINILNLAKNMQK